MSEFYLDKLLLIRSPAYSYENFNEQFLRKVLSADFFRAAIFFASRTFFLELQKKDFDYELLTSQAQLTLWKYLNRMCYRSLPYGLFSSYSTLEWTEEQWDRLVLDETERLTLRPDFKILAEYIRNLNPVDFGSINYYANNSIYPSGKNLRFINQTYSPQHKFSIVELQSSPVLNKLLKFTRVGRTKKEIITFLTAEVDEDQDSIVSYFDSLLSGQVITSELLPNITGINYGDRCTKLLSDYPAVDTDRLRSHKCLISDPAQPSPELNAWIDKLGKLSDENSTYTLYQRDICGNLSPVLKSALLLLVAQMDKLSAGQDIDNMKIFKSDFLKKYDQQEISLMETLDPGMGIGYENLASAFDPQAEDYISNLRAIEEKPSLKNWGQLERMIFKKWNNLQKGIADKIVINLDDLAALPESGHPLPPGFFILFKVIDQQIWLDNIGGVSGIELSARFNVDNIDLQNGMDKICAHEMEVNKEYVFAEIAFSPNDRASNINQRDHLYPYEIPVLTHVDLDNEFMIRLDDLMVSVRENKVFLRSKRLNRFIIPRLSSAYNYQLSTVPVFRFLCDLQFQGIKSNLSFSLTALFPGLDYYPRVEIEKTVISPATWILNEEQVKDIAAGKKGFVEVLNLPLYFRLQEGDNFLVFNTANEGDWPVFIKCIKNKKSATLIEHVVAENEVLKNKDGMSFSSQIVACVLNQSKSYTTPEHNLLKHKKSDLRIKRTFLPGQDWLYLKLYTHYSLTDEILVDLILPIIKKYKKMPGFKWFFIRYQDPADHLRLRFLTDSRSSSELLADLVVKLQPCSASGKITDVLQDSYKRELEKYSPILINDVESFFYQDSEYILSALKDTNSRRTSFKLSFAINSSLRIIHSFITDKKECLEFLNAALTHLSSEFNRTKDVVHKLDVKYRNFQKELISAQSGAVMEKNSENFNRQLLEIRIKTMDWNTSDQSNLLINLVHMHINRVFERNPREYEYVIYHFMKKHQAYLNHTASGVF